MRSENHELVSDAHMNRPSSISVASGFEDIAQKQKIFTLNSDGGRNRYLLRRVDDQTLARRCGNRPRESACRIGMIRRKLDQHRFRILKRGCTQKRESLNEGEALIVSKSSGLLDALGLRSRSLALPAGKRVRFRLEE